VLRGVTRRGGCGWRSGGRLRIKVGVRNPWQHPGFFWLGLFVAPARSVGCPPPAAGELTRNPRFGTRDRNGQRAGADTCGQPRRPASFSPQTRPRSTPDAFERSVPNPIQLHFCYLIGAARYRSSAIKSWNCPLPFAASAASSGPSTRNSPVPRVAISIWVESAPCETR
jgi:hypothetical protein